jgi:hypothetical protein
MLEVQGAKPLTVQRDKYKGLHFKNNEFICDIHNGIIYDVMYAPKCDIETYMFTWKNQILARYIKTCAQYYMHLFQEHKYIKLTDKLAIHCGQSIQNAKFLFLSNLCVAFFMQSWCVRYLQAVPEAEETLDLEPLLKMDPTYPLHLGLIVIHSGWYDDLMVSKYQKVCESYKTLSEFFKLFTKRSRFKDCLTWLPGIINHNVNPVYKHYKIPFLSICQTFDSVVCVDVEHFEDSPYIHDSLSEIVIRNKIIYTTSFSWAEVNHAFESNDESESGVRKALP